VSAVWDVRQAHRDTTATRERICINGLWRFQPAGADEEPVPPPGSGWGYFKVPGPWPADTNGDQTIYAAEGWQDRLRGLQAAWYEREIAVPEHWEGRRVGLSVQWLNSFARIFIDGREAGTLIFPGGEADITAAVTPGRTHSLAIQAFARRLTREQNAMLPAGDGAGRRAAGIARGGLVGDVYLTGVPSGERITHVRVDTSVRRRLLTIEAGVEGLREGRPYALRVRVMEDGREVLAAGGGELVETGAGGGRMTLRSAWADPKLWDADTPGNQYDLLVELVEDGRTLDAAHPVRFGFREFWIDGRDFYLNGSRVHLRAVPIDSAQIRPGTATYEAACGTIRRHQMLGFNAVYTHNYGCTPGSHIGFDGMLKAGDDTGMLLCFSLPSMRAYDWSTEEAVAAYRRHLEWYVRQAQNHPSVIMFSQNHNVLAFSDDQNPQRAPLPLPEALPDWYRRRNAQMWDRIAILREFDTAHPVYNHSGPAPDIYTVNCYLNWVPMQERAEWFQHWAREGRHALFLVEYGEPLIFSYNSGRGPWNAWRAPQLQQYHYTEWGALLRGDAAYDLSEFETGRLRWEAEQWRIGEPFDRGRYPLGHLIATDIPNLRGVQAEYITHTWPYFRTLGLSGFNIWHYWNLCSVREGVEPKPVDLPTDWENLQRPGLSVDRIPVEGRMQYTLTNSVSDWPLNVRGEALLRYNRPLLAYIAGGSFRFTEKGHNYLPGEQVDKQVIVVNDSRRPVVCDCTWTVSLPDEVRGKATIRVEPGENGRSPLRFPLPDALEPGEYAIDLKAAFDTGEVQEHSLALHVLAPAPRRSALRGTVALFDPAGETAALLRALDVPFEAVEAGTDLSGYNLVVIGKRALTVDGPGPDLSGVRDGLKVVVFEQTAEVLERRLGFRVAEYGLRKTFARVPDHPVLRGLSERNLRDWHGEATLVPPAMTNPDPNTKPKATWCGFESERPGRAGCYGNVCSVAIEKPTCGDFLPLVDGGFALKFSPLLLHTEGRGLMAFCQADVTGRTREDPAARQLAANLLEFVAGYSPSPARIAVYAGEEAGFEHLRAAGADAELYTGQTLGEDRVVVLGPGAAERVGAHAAGLASWIRAGGRVVAVGIVPEDAAALIAGGITFHEDEHIACVFEPPGAGSAAAGIGCGDLMIRDPRTLWLVASGAAVLGNGVLAHREDPPASFLQLVPWQIDYRRLYNAKRGFQGSSFAVNRLLANTGVPLRTPLPGRFADPVEAEPTAGRWLEGLYLDEPVAEDDPYRYFRW